MRWILAGWTAVSILFAAVPAHSESFTYLQQWGTFGPANGQFNGPQGIAFRLNELYVADSQNHRIQVFTADGTFLRKFGMWGTGNGQFKSPWGVGVDSQGNIYVADRYNHRIQKFTSAGTYVTQWGTFGTLPGEFSNPWNVAVDYNDIVYVAEYDGHRVQRFTTDGAWIDVWGEFGTLPGQFKNPRGIGFSPDGYVYIAGSGDDRIQKFDSDGGYILEWGGVHGSEPGQFHHPNGLTVDGDGFVYTLCWYAHPHGGRIQKFTPWGQYLGETGGIQGTGNGQYDHAQGLAVTPSGLVIVSDHYNHRIQTLIQNASTSVDGDIPLQSWGRIKQGYRTTPR